MKHRIPYLGLIAAVLLSACSGGGFAPLPTVTAPAAQATLAWATAAPTSNSRADTTAFPTVELIPAATASAAQAISASATVTPTSSSQTQETASAAGAGRDAPPAEAIAACAGRDAQATCEFTWQKGVETDLCEMVQGQMTCSPQRGPAGPSSERPARSGPPPATRAGEAGGQTGSRAGGGVPPPEAIAACTGKDAQAACEFTWQKGVETGLCEIVQGQMTCSPQPDPAGPSSAPPAKSGPQPNRQPSPPAPAPGAPSGAGYNVEQAISDRAQGMTIAFDALAFLTGDLGSDSFFPPGKVADFWGFRYLRDNDPSRMGHAGDFLTSAAMNVLNTLSAGQRAQLVALAESQVSSINEYGTMRFVLMDAFRRLLEGDLPAGATGLSEDAVKDYSAKLYRLDGEISFARAQLMGSLIASLDTTQRAHLDGMVGKGMLEWPRLEEPADIRGLDRDVKVAVMTYAADLFSWYAGSLDADVYFCPERHGTYFGSFYLKDQPAMSDPSYAIPADLTGKMGDAMLAVLSPDQAAQITGLVEVQRPSLAKIVDVRRRIAAELRRFPTGGAADSAAVSAMMEEYGRLDGAIVYALAASFARVGRTLTGDQQAELAELRRQMLGDQTHPAGAYLYSQAVPMPEIPNTDFLFK